MGSVRGGRGITLLITAVLSVFCLFCVGCDSETNAEYPISGLGIFVSDIVVEYDGAEHGVEISGLEVGDTVEYSVDGRTWSFDGLYYSLPGEYTVYIKVTRGGVIETHSATLEITRTLLDGIVVNNTKYVYDGSPHSPDILGLVPTDVVAYTVNGERHTEVALTEIGLYEITVEAERLGQGYYVGSGTVEIVPDLSGTYVSRTERITLTTQTAIIHDREYGMEYGYTGAGVIEGIGEFTVDDARFILCGKEYVRPTGSEHIFAFEIVGLTDTFYGIAPDGEVTVSFDGTAHIAIGGTEIAVADGNYCESVERSDGITPSIARSFESSDIAFSAVSITDITAYKIRLSTRAEQTVDGVNTVVYYDGAEHGIDLDYVGILHYKTADGYTDVMPTYTEPGEYEYAVIIERDGFLPKQVVCVLTIAVLPSGVYVSAHGLIEFTDSFVIINGKSMDISAAEITFDGTDAIYAGERYEKSELGYAVFILGGIVEIMEVDDGDDIYIYVDDGRIEIENGVTEKELSYSGTVETVTMNGDELTPIGNMYIIGQSDLYSHSVVYVVFG